MNAEDLSKLNFQTFYISKEKSNCPYIADVIKFDKNMKDSGIFEENSDIVISLRNGKRVLITGEQSKFGKIKTDDFIEIVDYDALKRILLVMGPSEPKIDTPIHWFIHHAKKDVNASVQIESEKLMNFIKDKIPETEKDFPKGTLELIKEILKGIRNSKALIVKNNGVLFVGNSLDEVERYILETMGNR